MVYNLYMSNYKYLNPLWRKNILLKCSNNWDKSVSSEMAADMFWTTSTPAPAAPSSQWSGLPPRFSTTVNTATSQTSGPSVREHEDALEESADRCVVVASGLNDVFPHRCGDVGDLLRGSNAVWEPIQLRSGERHHQRDPAVPTAPRLPGAVHHHVPLLARGTEAHLYPQRGRKKNRFHKSVIYYISMKCGSRTQRQLGFPCRSLLLHWIVLSIYCNLKRICKTNRRCGIKIQGLLHIFHWLKFSVHEMKTFVFILKYDKKSVRFECMGDSFTANSFRKPWFKWKNERN